MTGNFATGNFGVTVYLTFGRPSISSFATG